VDGADTMNVRFWVRVSRGCHAGPRQRPAFAMGTANGQRPTANEHGTADHRGLGRLVARSAYDTAEGDRPRHPDRSICVVCRSATGTVGTTGLADERASAGHCHMADPVAQRYKQNPSPTGI